MIEFLNEFQEKCDARSAYINEQGTNQCSADRLVFINLELVGIEKRLVKLLKYLKKGVQLLKEFEFEFLNQFDSDDDGKLKNLVSLNNFFKTRFNKI